ncbi:MAG: phage antirepressor KilAC domain-containing protein [Plesiomonas shigelloides]
MIAAQGAKTASAILNPSQVPLLEAVPTDWGLFYLEFTMNQLIAMNSEITMGTREIAEMLGKRHDNIKASAARLVESGVILTPAVQEFEHRGNVYTEYRLNKRDSLILVAQNCPEFTAAIVDRWQELEAQVKPQIPQTYAAALLEAGRLAMELEHKEAQLAIAAPKADVYDRIVDRHNLLNASQVAKQVGISAVSMNKYLDAIGGVYSKSVSRSRVFLQSWIDAGNGKIKQTEQGYPQALFTTKGAARVIELLTKEGIV